MERSEYGGVRRLFGLQDVEGSGDLATPRQHSNPCPHLTSVVLPHFIWESPCQVVGRTDEVSEYQKRSAGYPYLSILLEGKSLTNKPRYNRASSKQLPLLKVAASPNSLTTMSSGSLAHHSGRPRSPPPQQAPPQQSHQPGLFSVIYDRAM